MSPEQAAGEREIDGRSDLYSLGILGYQMLTGEPPFIADSTPAMLVKHISERPIPVEQRRSDVPQDLARVDHDAAREGSGESIPDRRRRSSRRSTRARRRRRALGADAPQRTRRRAAQLGSRRRFAARSSRTSSSRIRLRRAYGQATHVAERVVSADAVRTADSAVARRRARRTSCAAGRIRTSSGSARSSRRICSSTA